jgi:hypothetical protein
VSTLPLGLQALVWAYALVAGASLTGCLALLFAGLAHGRHRRRAEPLAWARRFMTWLGDNLERHLVTIGQGLVNGVEWLAYGGRA